MMSLFSNNKLFNTTERFINKFVQSAFIKVSVGVGTISSNRNKNARFKKISCSDKMTLRNNYLSMVTPFKYPIKKIIKIFGYALITLGLITILLPTGSPFIIISGLSLLGINMKDLKKSVKNGLSVTTYKLQNGVYKRVLKDKLLWKCGNK